MSSETGFFQSKFKGNNMLIILPLTHLANHVPISCLNIPVIQPSTPLQGQHCQRPRSGGACLCRGLQYACRGVGCDHGYMVRHTQKNLRCLLLVSSMQAYGNLKMSYMIGICLEPHELFVQTNWWCMILVGLPACSFSGFGFGLLPSTLFAPGTWHLSQ